MPYYDNFDPFSVCFNMMKIKYPLYDESLTSKNFLRPNDKVNVFINLETAFKYLSMIQDLEKKLVLQKRFDVILTSNILNLAAHYKRFFVSNGLDTRVYLYHTDFKSDEFPQYNYNEDFRSYYLLKYNNNPKFLYLTDQLKDQILPDVRTYCEFIPHVYYIASHNIEGSLIPYIISQQDTTRKNFIVGGELYDSQYSLIPNFVNHLIYRRFGQMNLCSSTDDYVSQMTKKERSDCPELFDIYSNNKGMYLSLLSSIGDKSRSIDGLPGIGPVTLTKKIESAIHTNKIQTGFNNPVMIKNIFDDEDIENDFVNNFYCTNVENMYEDLHEGDKQSIYNQVTDRFDNNSLMSLNSTKFYNYPLLLEALTT